MMTLCGEGVAGRPQRAAAVLRSPRPVAELFGQDAGGDSLHAPDPLQAGRLPSAPPVPVLAPFLLVYKRLQQQPPASFVELCVEQRSGLFATVMSYGVVLSR